MEVSIFVLIPLNILSMEDLLLYRKDIEHPTNLNELLPLFLSFDLL